MEDFDEAHSRVARRHGPALIFLERATAAWDAGDYPQAADAYEKFLYQYPTGEPSLTARFKLANIYYLNLRRYDQARGHYQEFLRKDGTHAEAAVARERLAEVLAELGRTYEAVIRVNSQSGKGGIAYVLKADHGLDLPRSLQIEFSRVVQEVADRTGKEITSEIIWSLFRDTYLREDAIRLVDYTMLPEPRPHERRIAATVEIDGTERQIEGVGNGPIAAFVDALQCECGIALTVLDYHENAVGAGADAQAAAYVQIKDDGAATLHGVGMDSDIVTASLKAVASAASRVNRRATAK